MADYYFFIQFSSSHHLQLCPTISVSFASKQFHISYHTSLTFSESYYETHYSASITWSSSNLRNVFRCFPTVISRFPFWEITHYDLLIMYMWLSYILALQFRLFQGLPSWHFFSLLIIMFLNTLCKQLSKSKLICRVLYGLGNYAISRSDEELWVRFAGISHFSQVI